MNEKQEQAMKQMFDLLQLDEFQRIAVSDLLKEVEGFSFPPAPGSEHERKLMEIGAIVCENGMFG